MYLITSYLQPYTSYRSGGQQSTNQIHYDLIVTSQPTPTRNHHLLHQNHPLSNTITLIQPGGLLVGFKINDCVATNTAGLYCIKL